jgi:hypothetical protein
MVVALVGRALGFRGFGLGRLGRFRLARGGGLGRGLGRGLGAQTGPGKGQGQDGRRGKKGEASKFHHVMPA